MRRRANWLAAVLLAAIFCVTEKTLTVNHPSGDPTPSPEDVAITRQLVEAGKLLGAGTLWVVLDHLVIGHGRWKQFARAAVGV